MRFLVGVFGLLLISVSCSRKAHQKTQKKDGTSLDTSFQSLLQFSEEEPKDSSYPLLPYRAKNYQGSYPLRWQLIHTDLSLSLDWARKELPGEAQLTLKPYFSPQRELVIDAKSFQIEEVRLLRPSSGRILSQRYDTLRLYLTLDRAYTVQETLIVYIRYRAQPERLEGGGSMAIGGRKGAYFINADQSRPCVPRQFWTQGEPESASAWFPTLDSPNQKTTQRLCVTIEDSLVSLSNGLLTGQKKIAGGLRQDCWELRQPHSPYLFALIVGPFRIIKDTWRGKEVAYYMEPGWESQARVIFGKTPQMLEFFSQRLGVEFPWPKYGQVIVRDFVSGAMENTTAVVHGDMLFYDEAKALTEDHEDVVAHELFHHWFGDLVSCEGWAQLPLNESFADYSEYLWLEHSRGIEAAEAHRRQSYFTYLAESREKKVPLIRYQYGDPMNMFDAHSYQKGGLVLHLLRQTAGDSAFFLSLKQYLVDNAYRSADIDHLRHAFEKVTGQDWTWFFDQHFHRSDEVRFIIRGEQRGDSAYIRIFQREYDTLQGPYRYFIHVALLSAMGYEEVPLLLEGDTSWVVVRPGLRFVDVDPHRLLIGQVKRSYPLEWWEQVLSEGHSYWSRVEALNEVQPYLSADSEKLARLFEAYRKGGALWRAEVWDALQLVADSEAVAQVLPLAREAIRDSAPIVRAAAWRFILSGGQQELFALDKWTPEIYTALSDKSSEVQNNALIALFFADTAAAQREATKRMDSSSEEIFLAAVAVLLQRNDTMAALQLVQRYPCLVGASARAQSIALLVTSYQRLPSLRARLFPLIQSIARTENPWYLRLQMVQYLKMRVGRDPEVARLLRQLKEEETHPVLRSVYQRML
ncbi:MAG: M1 family metallopeptidase [Bacteroidia bacterium]|nr:M1 family metallopeptidase [Bacteroidia bacterium]